MGEEGQKQHQLKEIFLSLYLAFIDIHQIPDGDQSVIRNAQRH